MPRKLTRDEFIRRARIVHNDKYAYDKVVYVNNATPVVITCQIHGDFEQIPCNHLNGHGCQECGNVNRIKSNTGKPKVRKNLVFGVGVNDYMENVKNKNVHMQSYIIWHGMFQRCYAKEYYKKRPTYTGCSVCEEWQKFSNFKYWLDNPSNGYRNGYQLDKDVLIKGNKVYSPETCCFVPQEINTLFIKSDKTRGDLPIGVGKSVCAKGIKYTANFSKFGKRRRLGTFDTPEEAFNAYKSAKEKHIQEIALEYYSQGKITERVYNALMNYKVEITD